MSAADKWDAIWREAAPSCAPARVLAENAHLLPSRGIALDLACGLGGNALFLAERGLTTWAFDVSRVAIERLAAQARALGVNLSARVRDIEAEPPEAASYDVIVVSRFLHRPSLPNLIAALKPGALLFYQTYTRDKLTAQGPKHPDYLLAPGELLRLFSSLRLLVYREEGRVGELTQGWRDEALLVAQKP